jgi:hypothetical protein
MSDYRTALLAFGDELGAAILHLQCASDTLRDVPELSHLHAFIETVEQTCQTYAVMIEPTLALFRSNAARALRLAASE